ncbi:ribbon-helix-helix domain-containing protein [uncultured Nostoc sp.]|uniref:ribbon-helix-helix domain-containing protein n=1 Tax=uncultured Nostoc sp. TaxID=340711 RepID=UPI0035C962A6
MNEVKPNNLQQMLGFVPQPNLQSLKFLALTQAYWINITLPDETIELIDQVIEKGDSSEETLRDRSRFINEAVQYYIAQKALVNLRELLQKAE